MHLHNGPLTSHLPNHLHRALSLVNEQHLKQKGLERIFPEAPLSQSFSALNDFRLDEAEEETFNQTGTAANGTDVDELHTRQVVVEVENVV